RSLSRQGNEAAGTRRNLRLAQTGQQPSGRLDGIVQLHQHAHQRRARRRVVQLLTVSLDLASFPNSAWERPLFETLFREPLHETEFRGVRSQTEFGNEQPDEPTTPTGS